jgi:hypothetical protein
MPFEIYRTTAEQIIGATDAALQSVSGVGADAASVFLDTKPEFALEALKMAVQLGLLTEQNQGTFAVVSPCAKYLVTSVREEKAAVFRFLLEQHKPFCVFKERLDLATGVVAEAATQTRAICAIPVHRDVVAATLLDLGTYANALTSQGAGLYLASEGKSRDYLKVLNEVVAERASTELFVRRTLEREAAEWIDRDDVLENLVTAYQRLVSVNDDPRAPIVHAGNAFESFLVQLAAHYATPLQGANGINAKADALRNAGHLSTKHRNLIGYLGHVRNAADHGVDTEIGHQWLIRENTAIEYVHVILTAIRDLVDAKNGKFIL